MSQKKPADVKYRIAVQVGKKVACSMGYAEHADSVRSEKWEESKRHIPRCYHNVPEGTMSAHEVIPFNRFVTTEEMNTIQWKLTNETDTVMKLACQKAVGEYHGRKWTAWFTTEIPCAAGPWRLHGLPGLILKAEADGIHRFECFDIDFVKEPIVMKRSAGTKVKHSKFVLHRNQKLCNDKFLDEPDYLVRSTDISNAVVMQGTLLVNGIISMDMATKYQPLELK